MSTTKQDLDNLKNSLLARWNPASIEPLTAAVQTVVKSALDGYDQLTAKGYGSLAPVPQDGEPHNQAAQNDIDKARRVYDTQIVVKAADVIGYPASIITSTQPKERTKFRPKNPGTVKLVTLFRHVRAPGEFDVYEGKPSVSNLGGITFYIELIDRDVAPMFSFGAALNGEKENFNAKTGCNIALGRFRAGQTLTGMYQRDRSLVQNIEDLLGTYYKEYQDLVKEGGNGYARAQMQPLNMDLDLILSLYQRLRKYDKLMPREVPPASYARDVEAVRKF